MNVPNDTPTVRRRTRKITDDVILDAAAAEFAEHGFEGANMADIAARAHTTKPTIYANFANKHDLYAAVVRTESVALRGQLLATYASVAGAGMREQLHHGTVAIFDFARARPNGFRVLFLGGPHRPGDEHLFQTLEDIYDAVTGLVAGQLKRSGEASDRGARYIAVLTVELIRAAARTAAESDLPFEAAAAVVEDLAFAGLSGMDLELIRTL